MSRVENLVGGDVVKEFGPAFITAFAESKPVRDNAVRTDCDLGRLSVDLQLLQHAFVCVSCYPGIVFSYPVSFQKLQALRGVGTYQIDRDPVVIAVADFVPDAP